METQLKHLEVERTIVETYRTASAQYRRDDEIHVNTPNHQRIRAEGTRLAGTLLDSGGGLKCLSI